MIVLLVFAAVRPLDHDESQYVAATLLARTGAIYKDFAYFQTPLQPLLFAPLIGSWALVELRLFSALLGAGCVAFVYLASRRCGASRSAAICTAGLFACCDSFLFAAAVARNDMAPACAFAAALWLMAAQVQANHAARAVMIGLLLSAATAAKLSYAIPAFAYGVLALTDRRHRPGWLIVGAVPPAMLVAATWIGSPQAFAFDVLRFPVAAPEQFYTFHDPSKLALTGRAIDTVKFLALGPALLIFGVVIADLRRRDRRTIMLDVLIAAGAIGALLPAPTWRQYLLVMLVPLFVRASLAPTMRRPRKRLCAAMALFVAAGLTPSLIALARVIGSKPPIITAIAYGRALRVTLDRFRVVGPIATLSPQLIAAGGRPIDPRFAAGPFYFRSLELLSIPDEQHFALVSEARARLALAQQPPAAIITGGEAPWTSGDDRLDAALAAIALQRGWAPIKVAGTPFTLFLPPRAR